jgi:hypothetical protein
MPTENIFATQVHFSEIEDANLAQIRPWEAIARSQLAMLIVAPAV